MPRTLLIVAFTVAFFVPSFCSVCDGGGELDVCSGTLPKITPCVDNKLCTLQNCSTFISTFNVVKCMPENAAPGDHCVTLAREVVCAVRGLCKSEQLPNQAERCVTGNSMVIIWTFLAEMGGECVLP